MKLFDTILLSLSFAFLIIGVHQLVVITNNESFANGLTQSYWLFMLTLVLFLYYNIRKKRREENEKTDPPVAAKPTKPVTASKSSPKTSKNR